MATILVADDEAKLRKILTLALMEDGHEILEAKDATEAVEIIQNTSLSLVITDLRMPGGWGMEVLKAVKQTSHYIPVIILTAYGTIENAVEALKNGAHDYLLKPCDLDEIKMAARKALQLQHLELENRYLREELRQHTGQGELVGKSPAMLKVFELIRRVAQGDGTVLIRGESGTGKELVARAIHFQSPRAERSFVSVNCSATPPDLLDLELFGRVRGLRLNQASPTTGKIELANGGTLFLDEIGDLTPSLQGKLLRLIEEKVIEPVGGTRSKKIDVRIIVSTNKDLEERVRKEAMRSDLYFRLNVLPIGVPPLRERKEDIPLLINHFLRKKSRGNTELKFSSEDIEAMMRYHWPGNVRELQNVVERAIVLNTTDLAALMPSIHPPLTPGAQMGFHQKELLNLSYKEAKRYILDDFERVFFTNLLRKTGGNVSRAAQLAQVHRKNLYVKLTELGIDPRQFGPPEAGGEESSPALPA
ncbi:MAG: sigma-54-dependent Fis family transcriptional regulator [Candidatus Omnitrophica bacterium]|nr:sigma-54-dependent Fis family transcriptional regulator [Candidatus Omnitrophota bacterium]